MTPGRSAATNCAAKPATAVPAALFVDPPPCPAAPAQTLPQAIPSGGVNLNAVLYIAAGEGPHPNVLLLHGLPGNEQNIDLAQSMRRAGWNVLTFHYRGSWGGPGVFSFEHCLEDAAAALSWLSGAADVPALRVDPHRIIVVGHSMGGSVAAHIAATRPEVMATALLSGVDLGQAFGIPDRRTSVAEIDENVGVSAGLHILVGTSPLALAQEAERDADRWRLSGYAVRLAGRPVLLVTSDDGFAVGSNALGEAIQHRDGTCLSRAHFTTDHSYSDCRIELQIIVLRWLEALGECRREMGTVADI